MGGWEGPGNWLRQLARQGQGQQLAHPPQMRLGSHSGLVHLHSELRWVLQVAGFRWDEQALRLMQALSTERLVARHAVTRWPPAMYWLQGWCNQTLRELAL